MNKKTSRSTRSNVSAGDEPGDPWHDLVVAVVAREGSPRVAPPASMLAGLERKLDRERRRGVWWRSVVLYGGLAAACLTLCGGLIWRATSDRIDAELVMASEDVRPDTTVESVDRTKGGEAAPGTDAVHPVPNGAVAMSEKANARPGLEKGGVIAPARGGALVGKMSAGGDVEPRFLQGGAVTATNGKAGNFAAEPEDLLSKSGYYVAGMLAAAMQVPTSENPYDISRQIVEWTEWTAGYERGSELPASVALALGDFFAAQNPDNPVLGASMPDVTGAETLTGDAGEGGAAVKADPGVVSKNTQAAE